MKKLYISIILLAVALSAKPQDSQTEYNFLRLPVSAHGAALGGENISLIEDDASLIFANPALLSSVSDKTIGLNYMNYMAGANMASVSFNRNVKERASWAISGMYIDYGSMRQTDENNVKYGKFSAKEISMAGYFSYFLTDRIAGGITAKFATSYIGGYNSIGIGVDLGINYYDPDLDLSLSAVAKNLGGQIKAFDEEYGKMPIDLQVGVSKGFEHMPFRVSASLVDLNHWDYSFIDHAVLGVDILLSQTIWVGGGYNFRRAKEMSIDSGEGKASHGAGLSFGAGINLERFKINLAYGKYHVSSSSIIVNAAYCL